MKKSIRILSILMAFAMLIGSFSVMGSAYEAYKGSSIADQYNDVDTPAFTIEQYASMALDEVDRMLAKEQLKLDLLGMLSLDLTSVDAAIGSVLSFLDTGSALITMLGDASSLPAICEPLKASTALRSGGSDLKVIYALLDFVSNLKGIAHNYVAGDVTVGILDGFIADFKFDVRELIIGMVYGMTSDGSAADYDYFDDVDADGDGYKDGYPSKYKNSTSAAITLVQDLLNGIVLGKWTKLDELLDDKYSVVMPASYAFVDASGNDVSDDAIDTAKYDYYGYVHESDWVTVGLGDAIRVANNAAAPAESYSVIDITGNRSGYDFIEDLMQRAYNYLLIPVLNRDTRGAVLELCGYTEDESKSKRTIWANTGAVDETGAAIWDWVNNPTYDPNYLATAPATSDGYTEYAKLFNHEAIANGLTAAKVTIPEGETFVDNFNTILGEFITRFGTNNYTVGEGSTAVTYSWTWNYDEGNAALFDNIVSVGKYIVIVTGDLLFEEDAVIPSAAEINAMDGQAIIALIMREILNNSVDYIYIDDSVNTIVDVGYAAVEQLAWQDIPQYTYTKPSADTYGDDSEGYYEAVVDKMLDILFDIAVYNLNQNMDMVLADGTDPDDPEKNGLLQYQGDDGSYENNLVQIASWALRNYGPLLALDFVCDDADTAEEVEALSADAVWTDLDTIINAIIPIKEGSDPWISADIAGSGLVSKTFIFDYVLKPIYTLDATNLSKIFERNNDGAFAKMNGVAIIVDILDNVFDLLFPNVFQPQTTLDAVLQNELLADMVYDLIGSLCSGSFTNAGGTVMDGRGDSIAAVALPVVCMLLGLSDDQEFEEMEIYMPGLISTTGTLPSFEIYNGSSGINTAYRNASGVRTQDQLYTYKIKTINLYTYNAAGNNIGTLGCTGIKAGDTISGGDSVSVNLTGTLTEANIGNLVEFVITYVVYGEDGLPMTSEATGDDKNEIVLSKTVYAYIGETDEDDDAVEHVLMNGSREVKFENSIYLDGGDDLDDITSNIIRIQDIETDTPVTATIESVGAGANDTAYFVAKETVADEISATLEGTKGIYFLYPFEVAMKDETESYERFEYIYAVDEEGNTVYNPETGEPVIATDDSGNLLDNGGVPNGKYTVTTVVDINGTDTTIETTINLYDDFGLESAFNNAVLANRQLSDYNDADEGAAEGLHADYIGVLKDVAKFVLKPKTASSFQTDIAASSSEYVNMYEELSVKLANAIEELDAYLEDEGIDGLKKDLAKYSGSNYLVIDSDYTGADYAINPDGPYKVDLEYDDEDYVFFGMRDFVPHTYNRYKDARNRITDLIESQEIFVPAPLEDDATDEEIAEYAAALEAYAVAVENMDVISSIDALYARHMLNLTGSRLIRVAADTSKLEIVYGKFAGAVEAGTESDYTVASLERYQRAEAFAAAIIEAGAANVYPSQVNKATTELTKAWKELAKGASYAQLDSAIAAAQEKIDEAGAPETQTIYTADSYAALYTAYTNAVNVDRDLSATESNNELLATLAAAINVALEELEFAAAAEPVYELIADEMFPDPLYENYYAPVLNDEKISENYTPDDESVTNYIYGLGVDALYDESEVEALFATLENCTIEIIPDVGVNEYCGGGYGSGAFVKIFDLEGNLKDVYCLVVLGDVNGDTIVDSSDSAQIYLYEAFVYEWDYDPYGYQYWVISDINNDWVVDASDAALIEKAESFISTYDMVTGEEYYL